MAIGETIGEKLWPMPLISEIEVHSMFADLKNISKDPCDGLFAARFLSEFIPFNVQTWLHIDFGGIASTGDHSIHPFGPHLLMQFVVDAS
jgi:leucyl aminopeptidase